MIRNLRFSAAVIAFVLVAGCTGSPDSRRTQAGTPSAIGAAAMVAAVRAAGAADEAELAVQPWRDPRIEDLRTDAERLEAAGDIASAVRALDLALEEVEGDPALLQERAELALLQQDFALAGTLAERAYALGSQVGPLCRRHWATLEQLRLREGDAAGATSARAQIEDCRVTGPERY
ncbi:hypothetical protein ACW7G2_05410 [Luteimonas sp. A277]